MNKGEKIRKNRSKRRKNENRIILLICMIAVALGVTGLWAWNSNQQSTTLMAELEGLWIYDSVTSYEFDMNHGGALYLSDEKYPFEYKIRGNDAKIDFIDDVVMDCKYGISFENGYLILEGKDGTTGGIYRLEKLNP